MTPRARLQAAIEIGDAVIVAAREGGAAADTVVQRYFATRRYAGSGDRRAVRQLVYDAIRRAGDAPATGRALLLGLVQDQPALADLFDGGAHGPAPLAPGEAAADAGDAPAWLRARLAESGIDDAAQAALLARAPLDLRVNRLKADRASVLAGWPEAAASPHAPDGIRIATGTAIEQRAEYREGLVEVQDEGSQLVTLATGAAPGMTVVDLCAGGGGKSLALAALMAGEGRVIACDVDRGRLSRLAPRAGRAGAAIETRLLDPQREAEQLADLAGAADVVMVDAPCSGTGTWRRNPEARWRLSTERIDRVAATQAHVLDVAAGLVASGGVLVYVVCSLLDQEGSDRVAAFLADNAGWRAEPIALPAGRARGAGWRMDPASDGTDGFFVARLRAP